MISAPTSTHFFDGTRSVAGFKPGCAHGVCDGFDLTFACGIDAVCLMQ
jgi:hypothetical protein